MTPMLEACHASFVNLDSRRDRLHHMTKELARVGIAATRERGMLPGEYIGSPERVSVMQNRTPGAIGCWFSQVAVMETALELDKHAFVMEDDLVFCSDFKARMEIIEAFCSTHPWDVIWLGGTFHVNPPWWHKTGLCRDAQRTDHPRMMRTYGAFSTHAYIVNKNSLPRILCELEEWLPHSMGIDWAFIQMQPKLHTYAFVPGCVKQFDNQSNIGKGITKFSGFAKLGPYWWADTMTEFDPTAFNWHEAA